MSLRLWIILLISASGIFNLTAQNRVIKGNVMDMLTQEPLAGAHISVDGISQTLTSLSGIFYVSVINDSIQLKITYTGYESLDTIIAGIESDTVEIRIMLALSTELLEQVIVTANRYGIKISELTVSADIIPAEVISRYNTVKLSETLDYASGVNIIDGQPNIRGGSGYSYGAGSRVLLLMDNMPILTGDAGFPTWSYIPLENAGNIEIIKGASSVLYGSSALNGIINFQTAKPTAKPLLRISLFGGIYDKPRNNVTNQVDSLNFNISNGDTTGVDTVFKQKTWWGKNPPYFTGINVSFRQKIGQLDLVAGGYYYKEKSYLKEEFFHGGRININTRYRVKNTPGLTLGLNLTALLNESANFFLWQDDKAGAYIPLENTVTTNNGFRYNIDPFVSYHNKSGGKHILRGRYFKADNKTQDNQSTLSDLLFGEYQFQQQFDRLGMQLTAGIAGSYSFVDAELYGDTNHHWTNLGAYIQIEKNFGEKLKILAGLRYEQNQVNSGMTERRPVFRFGTMYKAGKATFIRASVGQGYRYPTLAELFVRTDVGLISVFPNPGLESETGWSFEAGLKQGFQLGQWKGMADIALFRNEYMNMMEFSFGGVDGTLFGFQSVNIGDTYINGLEIMINTEGKIGKIPVNAMVGYTYIDPKYKVFDSITEFYSSVDYNILKYRYKHQINFRANATPGRFEVGMAGRYYSFMEAIDFVFEQLIAGVMDYRDRNNNGDFIFDLSGSYHYSKKGKVSIIIKNAFNEEYSLRPALMEPMRSLTLMITQDL